MTHRSAALRVRAGLVRARSTRCSPFAGRADGATASAAARRPAKSLPDKSYDALAAAHSRAVARLAARHRRRRARSQRSRCARPFTGALIAGILTPLKPRPCAICFDTKHNPKLAWAAFAARRSSRCWCCRSRWPPSAPRGCASRTSRSCTCSWRSGSTSSSASRACSTSATSRSTRWARMSMRCSRARTSTCTCRSGSSCRSAPRSRACSACCSARRR